MATTPVPKGPDMGPTLRSQPISPVDPSVVSRQAAEVEFAALAPLPPDDLRSTLARLAALTCDLVPGAGDASIVLGWPGEPDLIACSSDAAQAADGVQIMAACGPTMDAVQRRVPVVTADASADPRWRSLQQGLRPAGIRACVAVPLRLETDEAQTPIGALTVYAHTPDVLSSPVALETAERIASRAVSLIRVAQELDRIGGICAQLRDALVSRAVIDQAKGMVMRERRCGSEEAFLLLRRASNTGNRKIREIAQEMVDAVSDSTAARPMRLVEPGSARPGPRPGPAPRPGSKPR